MKTRDIAIAGVLGAVAVLLAVTRLGFIPFVAGTAITIMHVPVIIGATVAGPAIGTLIGLIFGVSSMILASVAPTGPGDTFFTDPLVSIVPRLFIAPLAWAAYRLARRAGRTWTLVTSGTVLVAVVLTVARTVGTADIRMAAGLGVLIAVSGLGIVGAILYRSVHVHPEELALSLAAIIGTLTNTLLVLGMLVARGYIPGSVAVTVGVANGPAEMLAAAIITVAVVATWRQLALRPGGASV